MLEETIENKTGKQIRFSTGPTVCFKECIDLNNLRISMFYL